MFVLFVFTLFPLIAVVDFSAGVSRSLSSMGGSGQLTLPMLLSRAAAAAAAANGENGNLV